MPELDEQVEEVEEAQGVEPEDPNGWGFEEGDEIVPGRIALKRLGGGYDYEAYLGWDEDLFALVVVKCLRPHLVEDARSLAALEREAGFVLRLSHPVVMRGFDAVTAGPRPHLVLEHLEGPNLSALLRKQGRLPLEQLLPLTLQICSALHYLHRREVLHLDVKPRNIIMGAPPRLIDFSIARTFERAARTRSPIGTDAFMAPEQCIPAEKKMGPPADVWGLGATLFQATSGHKPFPRPDYDKERDRENLEVRFPQLNGPPRELPKDLPRELVELIRACLSPDPAQRPAPADVVVELEPLVAQLPTRPVLRKLRPRWRYRPTDFAR